MRIVKPEVNLFALFSRGEIRDVWGFEDFKTEWRTVPVLVPVLYDSYVFMCALVPSLIEGLRVVQGLRVVPVFLYRYSMKK